MLMLVQASRVAQGVRGRFGPTLLRVTILKMKRVAAQSLRDYYVWKRVYVNLGSIKENEKRRKDGKEMSLDYAADVRWLPDSRSYSC
jgi:hypothetical protein